MTKRFNPPPNWPQPPPGWTPSANWQPDPAWGPAPPGWQLWVDSQQREAARAEREKSQHRVFISYRRSDCQPQANGLHDGLRHRLKSSNIFMDIDSIPPGVDFEQHIRREIEICDVVLVLIGDNWLDPGPDGVTRRIDEPEDFVRLEIESALASPRVRAIPVLVEGAVMPRSHELPESIRRLARINAFELSDGRWTTDVQRLSQVVESIAAEQEAEAKRGDTGSDRGADPGPGTSTGRTASAPVPAPVPTPMPAPSRPSTSSPPPPAQQPQRPPANLPLRPQPVQPPPNQGRASSVGWVMVALPTLCCGLTSFVPPLWAAQQRRHDKPFRNRMYAFAGAIAVLVVLGFILIGSAPTDSNDTPTGPASDVGAISLFVAWLAGTVLAVVNRNAGVIEPGIARELARRRQRDHYRSLVLSDPSLARQISVGRPDLSREYDDGGLLDLNNVSPGVLIQLGCVTSDEAQRIGQARQQLGRFSSVDEVAVYAELSEQATTALRETAVFL